MILEKDLNIDGGVMPCLIDFNYFKTEGEVTIRINHILTKSGKVEVSELVSAADIESLDWLCQKHYEQFSFDYWEQRYEERNSGLSRD